MSQTIDHRVVEMRFDNKQFEAGTKQTINSLGRLKEALKLPNTGKALEGLNEATKGIKLDGIVAGIEALEKRFSSLGIVGMRVIENITDGLMNKLHAAVKFVTNSIVSGGIKRAMNIENAHFQLQALLKDETKVQAVMANAMESVDGTAYAYDEAAKAASQFAASGIQAGDEMLKALKGITGVAAMTNSDFESISRIFTTIAGNGRLMGDQLLQLSSRGLNAASTLADYFREVRGQSDMTESTIREMVSKGLISFKDFSDAMTWAFGDSAKRANETFTGAMSNMKSALARIGAGFVSPLVEQNGELVQLFNALRVKINDVKSELVFDEQRSAISGLAEATEMTNDELSEMFSTIKTNGKVSISNLDTLTKKGANATDALTKYVNGVSNGSIRASYAITTALKELTNGTEASTEDIKRFVEEGKIDLATFTSAMETEFGTEKTLSKQFTDWFLDHVHGIVEAVNSADMTKPMEIFYSWINSIRNVANGLLSVLNPVGEAFSDVFLDFNADDIITFSEAVEKLTSKFKLSEKGSKNLHDAFKGLFDVLDLGINILFKLLGAVVPINQPVHEMGDGFLSLAGSMGRGLTTFTEMIRSCTSLKRAFGFLKTGFSTGMEGITLLIKSGRNFVSTVAKMEGTTKLIDAISKAFRKLGKKGTEYVEKFINGIENMFKPMNNIKGIKMEDVLNTISDAFSYLADVINNFSFKTAEDSFDSFKGKVNDIKDLFMSNKGFSEFVTNAKQYGEELEEAFTWDSLMGRLEKIMDVFGKFFGWIKTTMAPAFEDFNIGSLLGAGGGIAIIYALIKAFNGFEKISKSLESVTGLFGSVRGTLKAYQNDLKADTLLKIAKAIGILAISITILSFADMENAWQAAIMLGLVGSALILATGYFADVVTKTKTINDAAFQLSKAGRDLTKALKIKAIGSALKDFGKTILMIGGTIIAMGLMYKNDPEALKMGTYFVAGIAGALIAIMALGALAGKFVGSGMDKFSGLLKSITGLTIGLMIIVLALDKLFKINLPNDYGIKLGILAGILAGMAFLAIIVGLAGRIAGGGSTSAIAGYQAPWMRALGGISTSSNGGSITTGPILALAGMLYVTVLALDKLFKMKLPDDYGVKLKILAGIMIGMAVLMIAMGYAAKTAGGAIKAAGTILALAVFLAAIVASLYVLTIIPTEKLMAGAAGLGIVLLGLAAALAGAGKVTDKNTYKTILAMAIAVGAIAASLAILSMIPWNKLVISAVALGAILGVLAVDFVAASKVTDTKSLVAVGLMVAGVVAIAISLYELAKQPWEGLLAGAGALSLVLAAISLSFAFLSKARPNLNAMLAFGEGVAAVLLISYALYKLTEHPYDAILAAGTALSEVLLAMTVAMGIASVVGLLGSAGIVGMGILDLFIANLLLVLVALGTLSKNEDVVDLMNGGLEMLITLGDAIGEFVGAIVKGVLTQISSGLPQVGTDLSNFMTNLQPFIIGAKEIDSEALGSVALLAGCILALTAADVINGIANFLGFSMVPMAMELSNFMEALQPFIESSKNLSAESMQACGYLAEMILKLTAAELLSGIGNFLGFTGSLSDFAEELKDFGPAIAEFADTVKDVKPEAVEGAASAASIMAEVAGKLQGHGGLWQDIVGEKSLKDFAEELKDFGPAIAEFADTVKDVKPEAVEGAASAASIMAEVANKLPEGDSLKGKIFGNNVKLSEFGSELTIFARSIVPFCNSVKNVKPESVVGVSTATTIMSALANNLPDSNSLWNKIFGGGKVKLSEFGAELVSFGVSMSNFSKAIIGADPDKMNGVVTSFRRIIDLANYVKESSATNLVTFSTDFSQIGSDTIDKFIKTFTDSDTRVTTSIDKFLSLVVHGLSNMDSKVKTTASTAGKNLCIAFQNGVILKQPEVLITQTRLATAITNSFTNSLQASKFNTIGQNAALGLRNGIESKINEIAKAAIKAAEQAVNSAKKTLDEHSPSKVLAKVGEFFSLGLAKGIIDQLRAIALAGKRAAEEAINPVEKAVNGVSSIINIGDLDIDPVIRPVVDLSAVEEGVQEIGSLMNQTYNLSAMYDRVMDVSSSFNKNRATETESNGSNVNGNEGNTYEFNQYNYSPKALSRSEIYRQTNNQFSAFRRAVNPT